MSTDQPGQRVPEVSVLIDQHSANHGRHTNTICETSAGTPLPVSTVQRMCCDATIIGITLGADGDLNVKAWQRVRNAVNDGECLEETPPDGLWQSILWASRPCEVQDGSERV